MARVLAVCNQKGGVGKTTTSVNLASYLASHGKRVLLVDFDPQANASSGLGHAYNSDLPTIYHGIYNAAKPIDIIRASAVPGLYFTPANQHLSGALVELVDVEDREYFLRKFIAKVRHNFDYVLIDLPPSLSLLTINGMVAADEVLIPVQAEYYSLEGLSQLLQTVQLIRQNLHHPLEVAGAVITMYNKQERLSRDVMEELREHFPHHVYEVQVPRAVALAEAPSFSQPVMLYAPYSPGAFAYDKLAREIIAEENRAAFDRDFGNFNIES